jgi:putative transposase
VAGVELSEWAGIGGVSRQSATRWFHAGVLPVPARQLAAGAMLVNVPDQAVAGVAIYARVSSFGLRSDLGRQVARLALNVAGMTASAKGSGHWRGKAGLNRAILDVAPGELRRQLGYKCGWYGSALLVAGRWYPSSKACSGCGWRKPSLPLSERMFCCGNTACGLVIDRDLNAALNLAALVRALVTGTASSGGNRPGDHPACAQGEERSTGSPGCSSVNCEDGTGRVRPPLPPGNGWRRNLHSPAVTDETESGTVR